MLFTFDYFSFEHNNLNELVEVIVSHLFYWWITCWVCLQYSLFLEYIVIWCFKQLWLYTIYH